MSNRQHNIHSSSTTAKLPQQQASTMNNSKNENITKFHQQSILGGFASFDGDSLPDYSEFDSESVTLDYHKERYFGGGVEHQQR